MSSECRVLVLSRYARLGASSRVRFLQLLPHLAGLGITAEVHPLLDDEYIRRLYAGERIAVGAAVRSYLSRMRALFSRNRYDVIWVEKEALPWIPAWIEAGFFGGSPYVVDLDDAWYLRYQRHRSLTVRTLMAKKIDRVMGRSASVIAGNKYLAEHARHSGAQEVKIVPTAVDLHRYATVENSHKDTSGPFVIGWIGTPITAGYLSQFGPVLRGLAERRSIKFHIIGANPPKGFEGLPLQEISWSETTEIGEISKCDVGIMPLDNDAWAHGKCAYKLLQFMAAGKPVVASPVGANVEVIQHGDNGMLVKSSEEWISALNVLAENADLRERMGRVGRRTVELKYSVEKIAPEVASTLFAAAESRGRVEGRASWAGAPAFLGIPSVTHSGRCDQVQSPRHEPHQQ
jgi:glycosyltransferase involved in cell wall biosynthesis